jgi:formylglycine-generating enzyme required for sulfatase activity
MSYRPIGARRNRSAAWQWGLIGFIPGLFCGVIVMAGILLEGTLTEFILPTPAPQVFTTVVHVVMTATEDPNQPPATPISQFVVVTATPDAAAGNQVAVQGQQEPTREIVSVQVQSTALPTDVPTQILPPTAVPVRAIPAILESTRSLAVTIPGGVFTVGTTPVEVAEAVNECIRDGGTCEASYAEDSFPAHEVMVDSFLLETTEVTFEQYVTFLNVRGPDTHINGCAGFPCIQTQNESLDAPITFDGANYSIGVGLSQHPVYGVTYYGALAYCEAVGRRLPTEAEWERAARSGRDGERYPGGDAIPAWVPRGGRGPLDGPWPVSVGPPNDFGVRGIAANIHEWCADWHARDYYDRSPDRNPAGAASGHRRASRGGSWRHAVTISRVAARSKLDPAFRYTDYGFRVARDI